MAVPATSKTIFEVAAALAETRINEAIANNAPSLSLANLPVISLPPIISRAINLTSLDLSDCAQLTDLQPLAALTGLQSLDLSDCAQLTDLQPLAALTGLQSLDLSFCGRIARFQPLAALTSLQSLNLRGCGQITDLQPLTAVTGIESLDLSYCKQLADLQPLAALTGLQLLDLSDCAQLTDLQPLTALTGLQSLNLSFCGRIARFQPLAALTSLQSLDLRFCSQLADLQPLAALTGLQSLNLHGCGQITDLQPLTALSSLQSLDLSGCSQLADLQPLAALTSLQSLDLSYCDQIADLQPLTALSSLRSLNLRGCGQIADLQPLTALTSLQSLNLSGCSQLADLQPLAALTSLQSLDLSYCDQIADLQPLAALTSLQSLDLSYCDQIADLQPLTALTSLQSLNLGGCSQLADLQPLAALTSLQSLDLRFCDQIADFQPLAALTSLQSLNLSGCSQLADLQPLTSLTGLQSLDLRFCDQIADLQPLTALSSLRSLNLSSCSQLADLQPLAALTGLQTLGLGFCRQIADLQPLAALTSLQSLNLSGCSQLTDLQPLTALTNLRETSLLACLLDCSPVAEPLASWALLKELYANRIVSAPSELASEDYGDNILPQIRAWQLDLLAGEAPNSTLKVFILGNGQIGKTQIRRRLFGRAFDPSIPSTHGIDTEDLLLAPASADQPDLTAKIWDFGGQSIYLGTHGLFLDDRAVYVIAWTPTHENTDEFEENGIPLRNRPLTYWLEYVRSLAGPLAPVIVTQTQCDRESDVQPAPFQPDHGFKRLVRTYSSAKRADGVERLQLELKSAARYQFEQYGRVRLPLAWCAVANELEVRKPEKTISYADFESLCRTKHKTAAPSAVLEYLHRSGQVFYRAGAFGNRVVLDLNWALAGIYAVFDRTRALPVIREQGGRFSVRLLAELVWQGYGPTDHEVFISLMKECQICFEAAKGVYIAPNALPAEAEVQADAERIWRGASTGAAAHLQYGFLHEGVLRAMLCCLGSKAGEHAVYWAYGICFYDLETKSVARIRSQHADDRTGADPSGRIVVEASGPQAPSLVGALLGSIQQVNIGARPEVVWTLGEPSNKTKEAPKEPEKPAQPFASITPAQMPPQPGDQYPVYITYAWGDSDQLVDQFESKLPKTLRSMRDKSKLRPGDRISRFMQEIGRADCVLVAINEKYLRSIYCMQELLHLFDRSQGSADHFLDRIVPLIADGLKVDHGSDRVTVVQFWEEATRKLRQKLATVEALNVGAGDRNELIASENISHRVSDILSWVTDTLMPRGPDPSAGIDAAIALMLERIDKRGRG